MKKKIAILGSTGSIGTSTLEVIKNDVKNLNDNILLPGKWNNLTVWWMSDQERRWRVRLVSKEGSNGDEE